MGVFFPFFFHLNRACSFARPHFSSPSHVLGPWILRLIIVAICHSIIPCNFAINDRPLGNRLIHTHVLPYAIWVAISPSPCRNPRSPQLCVETSVGHSANGQTHMQVTLRGSLPPSPSAVPASEAGSDWYRVWYVPLSRGANVISNVALLMPQRDFLLSLLCCCSASW